MTDPLDEPGLPAITCQCGEVVILEPTPTGAYEGACVPCRSIYSIKELPMEEEKQ